MEKTKEHSNAVTDPHALPIEKILTDYKSSCDGLFPAETAMRLERVWRNKLPSPPKDGPRKRFCKHLCDTLIYILLASGAITALLGHWVDTGVILGVVVINELSALSRKARLSRPRRPAPDTLVAGPCPA